MMSVLKKFKAKRGATASDAQAATPTLKSILRRAKNVKQDECLAPVLPTPTSPRRRKVT
jgi:hypothetical protein